MAKKNGKLLLTLLQAGTPVWASGMALWQDFTRNTGNVTVTDTHAQTVYAPNSAGVYTAFGPNVLTRTDLGLQNVPTKTQLFADPSMAGWINNGATFVANNATAPDGTTTAGTLTLNSGANNERYVNGTLTAATYTFALFGRTAAGTKQNRLKYYNGTVDMVSSDIVATTSAQQQSYTFTGAAAAGNLAVRNGSGGAAGDLITWAANLYTGDFAVPPILSATTVNGNVQSLSLPTSTLGVAGFIVFNNLAGSSVPNSAAVMDLRSGSGSSYGFFYRDGASGPWALYTNNAGDASDAYVSSTAPVAGITGFAFVIMGNYVNFRQLGQAAGTPDTVFTVPNFVTAYLGGYSTNSNNNYQYTRQFSITPIVSGDVGATKLAEMYSKMQIAAAA